LGEPQFAEGNSGNGTFTVTVSPNGAGGIARNSTITLSTDAEISDVEITVSQNAGADPYVTLTPASFNAPASATSNEIIKTLKLSSNIETAFEVGWGDMPSWSYRAYTSDNTDLFDGTPATIPAGDNQLIDIKARNNYVNNTWNERSSTITLKGKAPYTNVSATVTFTQAAQAAVLGATGVNVTDIAAGSSDATINITGNEEWTASVTTGDEWITINGNNTGSGTGTVALTIAQNTVEISRAGTVTISGSHDATPVLIKVTQQEAPAADDKIEFTSSKNIDAEPAVATAFDSKTIYTVTFNATDAWNAEVVGGDEGWLSIDPASGTTGEGKEVTVTVNYFKGDNANVSKVRFTAGGKDYDVTVTDNYASKVVTHNSNAWAPTDVDAVGQFVSTIKGQGKCYQFNRNTPFDISGLAANTAISGAINDNNPGGTDWEPTPCPEGWSMPTKDQLDGSISQPPTSTPTLGTFTLYEKNGLYFYKWYGNNGSGPQVKEDQTVVWSATQSSGTQGWAARMQTGYTNGGRDKKMCGWVRCIKNE
jgi:hypothetical protein